MSEINQYVGAKIKSYRKNNGMTLQQLADRIHKSRATVSKYESGEITLDIQTLYDLSRVLHVNMKQLIDYEPEEQKLSQIIPSGCQSPFYEAKRLYFYYYDGRHNRLKDGIIDVYKTDEQRWDYKASLSIHSVTPTGSSSAIYYSGRVTYSDMLIRFTFENQYNRLEEALLYIFNPLEVRDVTEGLLSGISSTDLLPCSFKCFVTLTPQEPTEEFCRQLLFTNRELKLWQKLNMLVVGNRQG